MPSRTKPFIRLLLTTFLILGASVAAYADIVLEKKLVRRFDINWCPFFDQLKLHFTARTPEIVLTFGLVDPAEWGISIDNIAIVEEDALISRTDFSTGDYANFRSGAFWFGNSLECFGEPFFHVKKELQDGVPFKELFATSEPPEWILENASWTESSAPVFPDDLPEFCSSFYGAGANSGSLRLSGPEATASVRISGLKIGKKYFVTGWLSSGLGDVTVTVESKHVLSQASASFTPNGGTATIAVDLPSGGAWTATSHSDWISIGETTNDQAGGSVTYTVAANNGDRRTGTLIIAGQVFTVFQGANFLDAPPSHIFYNEISKLSARGITGGCTPGHFCPNDQVTHEQMAAFIIRALGVPNPPTPVQQTFSDVSPSRFGFIFIEEMAKRQINEGCGPGIYCPNALVTREEMAFLIIKSLGVFDPPTPAQQRFLDVPPSRASYAFVEEMAKRGITSGCASNLYCPDNHVTRGEMAAFLVRAFGL